jgi:hypothetical protein
MRGTCNPVIAGRSFPPLDRSDDGAERRDLSRGDCMFHAVFHLSSGDAVGADLDDQEIHKLIADLLAIPNVVPRLLDRRPSDEDLAEREGQLQLVAVAIGEELRKQGSLNFLAEHAQPRAHRLEAEPGGPGRLTSGGRALHYPEDEPG